MKYIGRVRFEKLTYILGPPVKVIVEISVPDSGEDTEKEKDRKTFVTTKV